MRILIFSVLLMCLPASGQNDSTSDINIGYKLSLQSKVLQEQRDYWVHTPDGYNPSKKYPVIYLLDGGENFLTSVGVLDHMTSLEMLPEMIIVGILNTDRTRDLTPTFPKLTMTGDKETRFPTSGGAKNFLAFVKQELIPAINASYSTQPYKMLIGHSFGGLFALYAALEEPELFQSVVAIDPSLWWDLHWLNKQLIKKIGDLPNYHTSIYIAAANNPDIEGLPKRVMIEPQEKFYEILSKSKPDNFQITFEYFEDESHATVSLIATYKALLNIFKGFQLPYDAFQKEPSLLVKHYKDWSEKLGFKIEAPESLVNQIGYELLWQNKVTQAIELFEMNIVTYVNSANAFDSLAEAYAKNGQIKRAITSYEKVLEIDANHHNAKVQLKKLNSMQAGN